MKYLIITFLISSSIFCHSQSTVEKQIKEDIEWLNDNTTTTIRDGQRKYNINWFFTEKGLQSDLNRTGRCCWFIAWLKIEGLSISPANRVRVVYDVKNYDEWIFVHDEYITPKEGVTAEDVLKRIRRILIHKGGDGRYTIDQSDKDEKWKEEQLQKEEQRRKEEERFDADMETIDGFFYLITGNQWEITGATSFIESKAVEDIMATPYVPVKAYSYMEAKLMSVYGTKGLRLNLSFLSFSWVELPSYTKYNANNGELIEYDDFYATRFWSPSAGLSYVFLPGKKSPYIEWEIPISVNYSFLLFPKNDSFDIKNDEYSVSPDSKASAYFNNIPSIIRASAGFNYYTGEGFGIGINIGASYMNINATTDVLTETTHNDVQRDFTYEFDNLNKIIPFGEFKLIIRF